MPDHPRATFRTIALAAFLVLPGPAAALSGSDTPDGGVPGPVDAAISVAQFQVLETEEQGDAEATGEGAAALEAVDAPAPDVETQGSVAVLDANLAAFTWQAQKDGETIVLTGNVPSAAAQSLVAVTTRGDIRDETEVAAGAPDGFLVDALTGLDALEALESGTLRYDGAWLLEGTLSANQGRDGLQDILMHAATPSDAWALDLAPVRPQGDAGSSETAAERSQPRGTATRDSDTAPGSVVQPETGPDAAEIEQAEPLDSTAAEGEAREAGPGQADEPVAATAELDEPENADAEGDVAAQADAGEAPATAQTLAAPDPEYRFSALKAPDGALTIQGHVPDASTQALVIRLAGESGGEDLAVNPRAPQDFVSALYAGLAALDRLDQGQLAYANGTWLLSGRAAIDTQKNEALAVLAALGGENRFQTMVTAPPASAVCRAEVGDFMTSKSILFASGSANLTPDSRALLPDVAQLLSICPQTTVYVEGHTDSDGGEALNLPLSVARAEAVVDELITLGVPVARLYAVGYGSSLPIASNDTIQGKRQNRRIAFTFEDAAQ